jgi:signal transduction histidine kinase/CheY-like chemotaxis protein
MPGAPADVILPPRDVSRDGLDFAHRVAAAAQLPGPAELLASLAAAFAADGAGVTTLNGGSPLARSSGLAPPARWPWEDPALRETLRGARTAVALPHPAGGSLLTYLARGFGGTDGIVWLESRRRDWSASEAAAFALAAGAVARAVESGSPELSQQTECQARQQQLEHAAAALARVAHDYGNVLTTILGFSELALAQQVPAGTALHRYLTELHQGAELGAELTQQLRRFARRRAAPRPCPADPILVEEQARVHAAPGNRTTVALALPADLPPVAIDGDNLRVVVRALLDNAVEATSAPGTVTIAVRPVIVTADACHEYYGDLRPGPHVEIRIADTGDGLSADVRRRLFAEPFFTTKARRRGYGLFAVYGVLHAHKGGLRLTNADRGAVAQVLLPVAEMEAPVAPSAALEPTTSEKLLVVDDDPLVLRYVAGALERAGYRVHSATGGAEAIAAHTAAAADPFRLVLSDVMMPGVSGVELAERLLRTDPDVCVLFMSGHASGGDVPLEISGRPCELLSKPFRSDGLLRAVRAALDQTGVPRGARAAALRVGSAASPSSR